MCVYIYIYITASCKHCTHCTREHDAVINISCSLSWGLLDQLLQFEKCGKIVFVNPSRLIHVIVISSTCLVQTKS